MKIHSTPKCEYSHIQVLYKWKTVTLETILMLTTCNRLWCIPSSVSPCISYPFLKREKKKTKHRLQLTQESWSMVWKKYLFKLIFWFISLKLLVVLLVKFPSIHTTWSGKDCQIISIECISGQEVFIALLVVNVWWWYMNALRQITVPLP